MTDKLATRKEEIMKEFDALKAAREQIVVDGKALQTRLNETDNKIVQLQGAYAEVEKLLVPEPKKVPEKK